MTTMQADTRSRATCGRCGCPDCQADCCKLECLSRPNFYSGQLLTDTNLKNLVDWVQTKAALQRFREGWGIACGLEVTCGDDKKNPTRVTVSSGYAIDCCGRDVVVCEPIWYDFTCEKPNAPCCREPKAGRDSTTTTPASSDDKLGCIPFPELRAYDLCLVFDEKPTGGQRPLVRGNCPPMGDCQPTRINEQGKLIAKEIKDPCSTESSQSDETYRRQLKVLLDGLSKNKTSPQILLDYVRGKLHSFCFVEDCLSELTRPGTEIKADWADEFIFYIIQDFRNHYFHNMCNTCTNNPCDSEGVPLARIWVRDKKSENTRICKIAYIDAYPPYRRLLTCDSQSTDAKGVDLSPYIWRELAEVRESLYRLGFSNISDGEFKTTDVPKLADGDTSDLLFTTHNSPFIIKWFSDHCKRQRVVAFEKRNP